MPGHKLELNERLDLVKLIKIVNGAEAAFIEAGTALADIRDRKLYREESKTFEEFCQKHWGYKKSHAYRLIGAAAVAQTSPIGGQIINERQARALGKAPAAIRAEIMLEAAKTGTLTAKSITEAINERKNEKDFSDTADEPPRVVGGPVPVKDALGITIPAKALKYWNRRDEILDMMKDLSEIKTQIASSQKADDLLYIEVSNSTLADLAMCREGISYALPYTVCPNCNGQLIEKCTLCKGRGVISKRLYQTVPAEIRSMREKRHGGKVITEDAGQSSDVL